MFRVIIAGDVPANNKAENINELFTQAAQTFPPAHIYTAETNFPPNAPALENGVPLIHSVETSVTALIADFGNSADAALFCERLKTLFQQNNIHGTNLINYGAIPVGSEGEALMKQGLFKEF